MVVTPGAAGTGISTLMQNTRDRRWYSASEMMKLFNQSMLNAAGKVKTPAEYAGSMIDLGVQVRQAVPPPAPNPPVSLTNYHITDIHKNRSPSLSRRSRRPLRLFHKICSILTPPKHLHKYINLHAELLRLRPNAEPPPQHPYLRRCHLGRNARLLHRVRTVAFLHRLSLGSSYSGRAYHLRRYDIRGVTSVVLYALLGNSLFYSEIAGGFIDGALGRGGEGYGAAEGAYDIL